MAGLSAVIARRLAVGVLILLLASVAVFAATEALPGDPARIILGARASAESVAELRRELELDRPAVERYVEWLGQIGSGDLGRSAQAGTPITELIGDRIANTAILALATLLLLVPLSLLLGVLAGMRIGSRTDTAVSTFTLFGTAVPEFVVAAGLILLFAGVLDLLPPVSLVPPEGVFAAPNVLVLPVVTLLITGVGYGARMVRASVAETLRSDYVQLAQLSGIPARRVATRYVLRNSLPPTVQVLAVTTMALLGGVVVVEAVFTYPGIGSMLVNAVVNRDIPVVQTLALILAAIYIVINLVADLVIVMLIPKLRTGAG